ncbi:MAG: PP2C family serine/threonine-protein phosphatase [Alphaproteobacteria bacterium]|nr:PP2C family serine/threonine-protein phosphatase [Alphaproteobacteria bacterium]
MLLITLKTLVLGMKNKPKRNIRVLATSIKGLRNANRNAPCQDHSCHATNGKNFVAVVSDGAGSAKYGKIGARIVCNTLVDLLKNEKFEDIKQKTYEAIKVARQKLSLHRLNKKNLNDFAATLVGVVFANNKGIFFHIGDGAAVAFTDENYDNFTISPPENGMFSCETYFYTMENWKENLRFVPFKGHNTFVLMSDGLTNFSFNGEFNEIEKRFLQPINQYLCNEPLKYRALNALNKTLSNPRAERINPDDKTILWAKCL